MKNSGLQLNYDHIINVYSVYHEIKTERKKQHKNNL